MKTKLYLATFASVALGAVLVSATTVNAETDVAAPTTSGITLYDSQIPGEGPFANRLALASTPAEFAYKAKKIPGNGTSGYTVSDIADPSIKNYIALSDDRSDKSAKWNLSATASELVSGDNKLPASYKLGFAAPQAYDGFKNDPSLTTAATPSTDNLTPWVENDTKIKLGLGTGTSAGELGAAFNLLIPADGTSKTEILTGEQVAGETAGRYGVGLSITSNQLAINNLSNNNKTGRYTGEIIWTLSDGI